MMTRAYVLHALSPLHAGTGQAADLIDLPIARLKGTNIPFVPGSSVKGVLRDGARADAEAQKMTEDELLSVFGPDTENAADHAGALVCSDARLLALPVRSFRGTFAYATSPLLLHLAKRDLGTDLPVPDLGAERVALTPGSALRETADPKVYFEDLDLFVEDEAAAAAEEWAQFLAPKVGPVFAKRFAIVDDATMTFLWETATQVDTRVSLNPTTRTVAKGALWIEESLPAESLLIGLIAAESVRRKTNGAALTPDQVLDKVLSASRTLQFGGKATVGRGRCRMISS